MKIIHQASLDLEFSPAAFYKMLLLFGILTEKIHKRIYKVPVLCNIYDDDESKRWKTYWYDKRRQVLINVWEKGWLLYLFIVRFTYILGMIL